MSLHCAQMQDLLEELRKQWCELIDDPKGPHHYCDSRGDKCPIVRVVHNKSLIEMEVVTVQDVSDHLVPRLGDLLVGVILRGPLSCVTVHLEIGGSIISSLELTRDEPQQILGGENFVPLLLLPYHNVIIRSPEPVTLDIVYAQVEWHVRHFMFLNPWSLQFGERFLRVSGGMGSASEDPCSHTVIPSMSFPPPWKMAMARQQERTKVFEEELVMIAWHPSRFREWCLDLTEAF